VLKRLDATLDETVPTKRPITLRDLLTFRMGFGQMMAPLDAYPILKAAKRGTNRNGPAESGRDARARRVDAPVRHSAVDASAG
jgi:hypothetical protein